ncbi:MAG: YceI family protein [Oxalobacteraceae bacterium]|nr:MAG: YceI family protein [Oxalobacteraceae bacterium]
MATENTTVAEAVETEGATQDAPAAVPVWTIKPRGILSFSVKHAAAGQIEGSFGRWSGNIAFDPERPEQADIRIVIDLSSASVGDPTQDTMLLGEEFLNAASFGTAIFTAKSANRNGADYRAVGQLELKGTKRSQAVSFELSGTGMNRRVQGRANLGREAFDIGDGPSGQDLDNNVTVSFSFDASGTLPPN